LAETEGAWVLTHISLRSPSMLIEFQMTGETELSAYLLPTRRNSSDGLCA
jgi:hypothetical protein